MEEEWFLRTKNVAEAYETIAGKQHKEYVKIKCKRFISLVEELLPKKKNLSCLDSGCGSGEAEPHLKHFFKKIVGIDHSPDMIKKAKQRKFKNCKFEVMDASKLKFKNNSFDVVVLFSILHHVPSKLLCTKIIKEAARVTKSLVFVFEMNPLNPKARHIIKHLEIDKDVSLGGYEKGIMPSTLKPKHVIELYEKNGLKFLTTEYLIFFPIILSFLRTLERPLFKKIPFGGLYVVVGKKI